MRKGELAWVWCFTFGWIRTGTWDLQFEDLPNLYNTSSLHHPYSSLVALTVLDAGSVSD
jgi:hypothetical protein